MSKSVNSFTASDFGQDFAWGTAIAAVQNEGAAFGFGKGLSIWDNFAKRQGKIKSGDRPSIACDFYHRYKGDLLFVKALGFNSFRFSISWPRILPEGTGKINKEGIAFYHRVIDECLALGLKPVITLYHWDLPAALEKEGGWTSHFFQKWFSRFVTVCAEAYGPKVKDWIVLNEPFGFTSLGYMLGRHAPGRTGLKNFLPAIHNAALAQATGGRLLRLHVPHARIGTSFSCSDIIPYTEREEDRLAADRIDILMNRLFIEPSLGMGFPRSEFRFIEKLELYNRSWKFTEAMRFDFDFIGLQHYFPVTVKYNRLIPIVQASEVKAKTRKKPFTSMGWEINPDSFYKVLKRFARYPGVKEIVVTENGASFRDKMEEGMVNDGSRINYFRSYLAALLKAKNEGVPVTGYYAWSLMDNFEWAEGYHARFGLIHVDFRTQLRTIKQSGYWFRELLNNDRNLSEFKTHS